MIGMHTLKFRGAWFNIDINLKRSITIIEGDSGIGKTTMVNIVQDYLLRREDAEIQIYTKLYLMRVVDIITVKAALEYYENVLLILDEGDNILKNSDKLKSIIDLGVYVLIVTRDTTIQLDYSISEIYRMQSSGKYYRLEKAYNCIDNYIDVGTVTTVVTEDSKTGYKIVKECFKDKDVISSNGNSNIIKYSKDNTLLIVDGACFGRFIKEILIITNRKNMYVSSPESIEYVILKILEHKINVKQYLEEPYNSIESKKFKTWEQYFTYLLVEHTANTIYQYSKNKCNSIYLQQRFTQDIKNFILSCIVHLKNNKLDDNSENKDNIHWHK